VTDFLLTDSTVSNAELDEKLERAVVQNMESEKLICCYLSSLRERRGYHDFGFSSIYDYATERFGFSPRKTRYLVSLGRKLQELPKLRDALRDGKIGWCKASLVASKASQEDEAMWLDTALSLSVRELEKRIKDGTDELASTIHFWMGSSQRVVWEDALELCRLVAGTELSPGEALEYIAGEFIATYAHLLRDGACEAEDAGEDEVSRSDAGAEGFDSEEPAFDERLHETMCPENPEELPTPLSVDYDAFTREIFERDSYQCTYPACTARARLHCHHIQFRSRGGGNVSSNGTTLCALHHRMLHGGVIGLRGRAPHELTWRLPKLMEHALARRSRNRLYVGELDVKLWPSEGGKRLPVCETATGSEIGGDATLNDGEEQTWSVTIK